jgi:hypothetical protein
MQNSKDRPDDHYDDGDEKHENGYPVDAMHHFQVVVILSHILLAERNV